MDFNKKQEAEAQIREEMTPIRYDTREYPIGVIVDKYAPEDKDKEPEFIVPDYQREFVWNKEKQSRFIESVLLDLPIPLLFFADNPKTGKLEIIDGSQRIRTLDAFIKGGLVLEKLEKLTKLNGFTFSDLIETRQRRFKRKTIRSVELTENASWKVRKDLFGRINTKPYALEPMQIRKGVFEGAFYDLLDTCSKKELFKELCPISSEKLKKEDDKELILRFFAYSDNYQNFDHRVDEFLDDFMYEKTENGFDRISMEAEFDTMLEFVKNYFPYGFKKSTNSKSTPRVRFEAIAIGVNLALREQPDLEPTDVEGWLYSAEFKRHTTSGSSNTKSKLVGRMEYVRDQLLEK